MILTTTEQIDCQQVQRFLGIVSGEAYLAATMYRDGTSGITCLLGEGGVSFKQSLQAQREKVLQELEQQAVALGGNAVIGIDFEYVTVADSMLMVTASGAVVTIGPDCGAASAK